ncbi:MAG: FliG C-terminal domain-containing protein [Planctomycetota bacterium]|nr:FliG C-terminal domain-containing protein [Planctomycetota bacterium]
MDTDRLGQTSRKLTQRVQGLTTGHWMTVAGLAGLTVFAGWVWTSQPVKDSDPWITLSVSRAAADGGSETAAEGDRGTITRVLDGAGLENYRFQGNRLQVRASQVEQTLATLQRSTSPEDKWTARWEDQVGQLGAFPTAAQYEQAREIALKKDIRQLLTAVPEIADVQVLLARSRARRSFGSQAHRVTATIGLQLRPGVQLTDDQIETLRQVVAGGVPDLVADDVVIFNQSTLTGSQQDILRQSSPGSVPVARAQEPETPATAPTAVDPHVSSAQPAWLLPLLVSAGLAGLVLFVTSRLRGDRKPELPARDDFRSHWEDESAEMLNPVEEEFVAEIVADPVDVLDSESEVVDRESRSAEQPSSPSSGDGLAEPESPELTTGRLAFLAGAEPSLVAGWLSEEHPQVAAVIVAELPEAFGVEVLGCLGEELRKDLENRMDGGVEVHEDVLVDVAETLRDRWRDAESRLLDEVVAVTDSPPPAPGSGWSSSEVALLQAVEGILPRFDDLIGVDVSIIRSVYDLVGAHPFRQALSGSDAEVRHAVLNRLAPLARMELARQIEQQEPARLADIERSQREILKHTRRFLAAADPNWPVGEG